MGTGQLSCPACAGHLLTGQVEGLRQYVCDCCAGVVIGIAVLRQLAGPVGQHIWTAEALPGVGVSAGRCPFCSSPMVPKPGPSAGTAAICKGCEVVWLDKTAVSSLPVRTTASPDQTTLETETPRCGQCGAPILHTWDEQCQYCGAAIHAPTKVVLLESDLPEVGRTVPRSIGPRSTGTTRLAHALAMLMTPVD
jgi:DNA-directed RNA polymerase subunit M/transcription elongation factor TFIIS